MANLGIRVGTPGGGRWVIARQGMGGYGDPPNYPTHDYSVEHWRGSRSNEAEHSMAVDYALHQPYVPEPIKVVIRDIFTERGFPVPTNELES